MMALAGDHMGRWSVAAAASPPPLATHSTRKQRSLPHSMCAQVYQLRVTTRSLLANASQALAAREPPVNYATVSLTCKLCAAVPLLSRMP